MPVDTYAGLECSICGCDDFRDIEEFRDHDDGDDQPCPGGSADA